MKMFKKVNKIKSKFLRRLTKIAIWVGLILLGYNVITSIVYGVGGFDSQTGMCTFLWSGFTPLWDENDPVPFGFLINEPFPVKLDGVDGPYIFSDTAYFVNAKNKIIVKHIEPGDTFTVKTKLSVLPSFKVRLRKNYTPGPDHYSAPDKLIAISDIEGNLVGFYSFLLANKVIDKKGNWIFGDGALVLDGDFMDRGFQVVPLLWFIYHLENQATRQGGKVHFILGNHEIMNLNATTSDCAFKYIAIAKKLSHQSNWHKAYLYLYFKANSVLGNWLRSKNIIEKIGKNIFVHGGLNHYHVQNKLSIGQMNTITRHYLRNKLSPKDKDYSLYKYVLGNSGPYWDRGLNMDWKIKMIMLLNGSSAKATSQDDLNQILAYYQASHIIIGHTNVSDISTGYNDKVIRLDVQHGWEMHSGNTKGILIKNNAVYKIDDKHQQSLLLHNQQSSI